jgi:ketosteroid isomerase-like protein
MSLLGSTLFACLMPYCGEEEITMKADATTEAAVKAVLDKLSQSYATRDLETVLASFAADPDTVIYGTGADEKRVGLAEIQAQVERDWSQSEAAAISFRWTSVSAAGSVAWVATDSAFAIQAGGQKMTIPARITWVLERRGDKWLIVQAHFSVPFGEQAAGESFPT